MENLFCRHLLTTHYPLLPLEKMKKEWNTGCANKKTVSGYPVYLFPPSALEKRGDYCVRPDQFYFLRKDPYTGKEIPGKHRPHAKKTVPATQEHNPHLCPVQHRLYSEKGPFVFLASPFPVRSKRDLPDSLVVRRYDADNNARDPVLMIEIRPSYIFSMHYYLVRLVGGAGALGARVKKDDIRAIYPLYDKETAKPAVRDVSSNADLVAELKNYFRYSIVRFSSASINALRQLKIRLPEPVRAYRGVFIHDLKELRAAKLDGVATGDVITIDSRGLPVSWSTDSCISQYFATHTPARKMLGRSKVQFGVLYSCVLQPEQVALDTRLFEIGYFKDKLYFNDQQEIITFPNLPLGGLNKFKCKVERLFLIDRVHQVVVLVHSFKDIVPFI